MLLKYISGQKRDLDSRLILHYYNIIGFKLQYVLIFCNT